MLSKGSDVATTLAWARVMPTLLRYGITWVTVVMTAAVCMVKASVSSQNVGVLTACPPVMPASPAAFGLADELCGTTGLAPEARPSGTSP